MDTYWRGRRLISNLYTDQSVKLTGPWAGKECKDWKRSKKRMLSVAHSIQLVQHIPYQGSSRRVWKLQTGRQVTRTVKYAGGLVLLAKEETVLQGMFDTLVETGRSYGMEMNL
jgi:hypothetical protein